VTDVPDWGQKSGKLPPPIKRPNLEKHSWVCKV